jgi:uncharacterized protein (DUF1778 family)
MENIATKTLQARLDPDSKRIVEEAARLRHVGLSDYIRLVLVPTARRELEQARHQVLQLTADEQERFWSALQASATPTEAQRRLGALMRGDL